MAITAAQRQNAMVLLLTNYGNDAALSSFVPGLTTHNLVTNLATALGTTFDAQFTTALNNFVVQLNATLTASQQGITDIQNQITANTVV